MTKETSGKKKRKPKDEPKDKPLPDRPSIAKGDWVKK